MALHRGRETGWARIGGYPELPDSPLGLGRWLKPTIRLSQLPWSIGGTKGQGSDLLGVTGNESPGKQMMPGLAATQLTSTLRTLHRRNLMSRHQRLVVAIFGRRGQAMELCQQFPRLRHHNQYRPMLGRSRHASELQRLLGVLTIFFYFGANHALYPVSRTLIAVPLLPNAGAGLRSSSGFRAASSRTIL